MTETSPSAAAPAAAVLDAAAKAAAQPRERFRIVRATLPNLLATMQAYSVPAHQTLDAAIAAYGETHPTEREHAVRRVPHYETLVDWCRENPEAAARIVLCSVYLVNGRFVAQEENPPPEEPVRAGDGLTADEARAAGESPPPNAAAPAEEGDAD